MPASTVATPENKPPGLIDLLISHKDDADSFFKFIKENRESLKSAFQFMDDNMFALSATVNKSATPQERDALLAKLPDENSKKLMGFMLDHPAQAQMTLTLVKMHDEQVKHGIDFMALHSDELTHIAKFSAEHAPEIEKLMELRADNNGKTPVLSILKDSSLRHFVRENAGEILYAKKFYESHGAEIAQIEQPSSQSAADSFESYKLSSVSNLLLNNPDEMKLFARGMPGIKNGLGKTLGEQEKMLEAEGRLRVKAQHDAALAEEDRRENTKAASVSQAFMQLKATAPDKYETMLGLEKQALEFARQHVSDSDPRLAKWYVKKDAIDPDRVLPIVDYAELSTFPKLVDKIDAVVKQQTLPAKPLSAVAKTQSH